MSPEGGAPSSLTADPDWLRAELSEPAEKGHVTRRPLVTLVIAATYLGLAFVEFWPAWVHGAGHWLQSGGQFDVGQSVFFLAQFPAALLHGLDPFANSWTNWPYGANYMTNTAVPLLALVMSPVTLAAGPIFSLNLLFTLAVWANCLVCYLVVGHFTRSRLGAFLAGLLYGFSPMATGGGYGHIHVVFALLPPVMFLLVWRLCTNEGRAATNGLALGVAMAIQLYVFPEPLADCAVVAAVGLLAAAVIYRRRLAELLHHLAVGFGLAAGSFLLLGAFGLYMLLDGPEHIRGAAHPQGFFTLSADLFSTILPTQNQRFTLGMGPIGARLTSVAPGVPDGAESGAYIGIPLLIILIVGTVMLWRRPLMRWAAGLALVSFVFSMGSRLRVDGHVTPLHLPFAVLDHTPLLDGAVAARYAMVEWFFLALMFGLTLAALQRAAGDRLRAAGSRWPRPAGTVTAMALGVVALVPLIPSWPYTESAVPLPSLAVGAQLRSLPTGQVLLGYPFPTGNTYLMVFQAEDQMRFRLVGGSLIQPDAQGHNLNSAAPPSDCQAILNGYFLGARPALALTATLLGTCAREMLQWDVQTVLWTKLGAQPQAAREFFTVLLGPPSVAASDSALWLHPQPALAAVVATGGVAAAARARASGL